MAAMGGADKSGKRILCVGLACVDIVNLCKEFLKEDTDVRVLDQNWSRGGNASNNSTVLKQLGQEVEYMGTMATSHEMKFLLDDFKSNGIITENCVFHDGCTAPVSIVILNQQNGTRTIMHSHKNLPELKLEEFQARINFEKYSWIHFEARPGSSDEVKKMLQYIHDHNVASKDNCIVTSVEVEKALKEMEVLYNMADYVLVSKDHAKFKGHSNKENASEAIIQLCRNGSTLICPWGDDGAIARTKAGQVFTSPAYPPDKMVDSLGAGDTFLASFICATSKGINLQQALTLACKIAGAKCGLKGFSSIKNIPECKEFTKN